MENAVDSFNKNKVKLLILGPASFFLCTVIIKP